MEHLTSVQFFDKLKVYQMRQKGGRDMELSCRERECIQGSFLFRGVPEEGLDWALKHSHKETASKNAVLYTTRQFRHSLGLVLSGKVRVTRGELFVGNLEAGDWFGAAALFNEREEYPSTLTALTDCEVLFMPQEAVVELLERWPRAGSNYVRYLSERICFLSDRLNSLAAGTAEEKVEQFLRRSADSDGVVCVSATAIAQALGLGRASVYRAFECLEARGILARDHKKFIIQSRETR